MYVANGFSRIMDVYTCEVDNEGDHNVVFRGKLLSIFGWE